MEQGFAEGATERHELHQDLTQLTGRVDRLTGRAEQGFAEAAADRPRIRTDMAQGFVDAAGDRRDMRRDIRQLKGLGHEQLHDDARGSGVAIVQDGTVDQESWDAAVAQA